ncbi:MAG: hypothetical protein R3B45_09445 [Bdellovibrionota bacterium]
MHKNLKLKMIVLQLVLLSAACTSNPYYEGPNLSEINKQSLEHTFCTDKDDLTYKVGQKIGTQICTVDLGLQNKYCINTENKLPYSTRAKNILIGGVRKTCIESKDSKTFGIWEDPTIAKELAEKKLKVAKKLICDFLRYEPYIKHEINLMKNNMDSHENFNNIYETPITYKFTNRGHLYLESTDNKTELSFDIFYDNSGKVPGYDYVGIRNDQNSKRIFSCTAI